jgi:hypothetical protein
LQLRHHELQTDEVEKAAGDVSNPQTHGVPGGMMSLLPFKATSLELPQSS